MTKMVTTYACGANVDDQPRVPLSRTEALSGILAWEAALMLAEACLADRTAWCLRRPLRDLIRSEFDGPLPPPTSLLESARNKMICSVS